MGCVNNGRLGIVLVLFYFLIMPFSLQAEEDAFLTSQWTLPNGLELIYIQNPRSDYASVHMFVKTGSIHEQTQLGSGLSHYLEHILSGGSTSKHTESFYRNQLSFIGGASNAYTTTDHTGYFINCTSENLPIAIEMISEWMFESLIDGSEFKRERSVIIQEMVRANANPYRQFYQLSSDHFYTNSALRVPVIGYQDRFLKVSSQDVRSYYQSRYTPDNMVLVIGGNLDLEFVKGKVNEQFASYQRGRQSLTVPVETSVHIASKRIHYGSIESTKISMRFPTIDFSHQDVYSLDLLEYVMGKGKSSPLYETLVTGLKVAKDISVSSYTPLGDRGYFDIYMSVEPDKETLAIHALKEQLARFKKRLFSKKDLRRAKRQKLSFELFQERTIEDRVSRAGRSMIMSGDPHFFRHYAQGFDSVDLGDLKTVASKYLDFSKMKLTIMRPQSKSIESEEAKPKKGASYEYDTLDNGLTVVYITDPSQQSTQLTVSLKTDLRRETVSTNGSTKLVLDLLGNGTASMSKSRFLEKIDVSGALISKQFGNMSLRYSLTMVPDEFNRLAPLFIKSFFDPRFDELVFNDVKDTLLFDLKVRDDSWWTSAFRRFKKHFFNDHPYGFAKSGEVNSVSALTLDQVESFYRSLLTPKSIVVSVVSSLDKAQLKRTLTPLLETKSFLSVNDEQGDNESISQLKESLSKRKLLIHDTLKQPVAAVMVGVEIPGYQTDTNDSALYVMDALLSGIRYPSGRLHTKLRGKQKGLVYEVHAFPLRFVDKGVFMIYALTNKQNIDQVKSIIEQELRSISKGSITKKEFLRAKEQVTFNYERQKDDLSDVSQKLSIDLLIRQQWQAFPVQTQQLKALTFSQFRSFSSSFFENPTWILFNAN